MTVLRKLAPLAVALGLLNAAPAVAQMGPGGVALDKRAVFDVVTENDYYASSTDQWYTTGTRFGYLRPEQMPQDLPGPVEWLDRQLASLGFFGPANTRYGLNIGQHIYTPVNVLLHNPDPRDHPYGGYAYGELVMMRRNEAFLDRFVLQAGVFGPGSWGRRSQDVVHGLLNQDVSHGWKYQVRQEYSLGLGWDRVWRFPVMPASRPFGVLEVDALPTVAVMASNVMTYGQVGGRLRLGRALDMDYGPARVRPSVSDTSPILGDGRLGWYVFGGVAARAVGRDISVEGNTFKASRGVERMNGVMDFDIGAAVLVPIGQRYVRVSYTQDWRTQEFVGQKRYSHFGSFNLSYAW